MRYSLGIGLLAGLSTLSAVAAADRGDQTVSAPSAKDKSAQPGGEGSATEEKPSPWAGSILLFDQSATTQTLGIGKDYLSSNPTYELWFAFKPRYTFYKTETTTISAGAWANLYLELTNSDSTTTEREPQLGPTILSGSIAERVLKRGEYTTTVSVGPRLTLPTDKESRNAGRYFSLGAGGGVSQSVPLNGKDASSFNSLRFEFTSIYAHPFNNSTTPTNPNINQARQDVDGRLVFDNQLRFGMNVQHSLSLRFGADAQLTPKLTFGLSYVIANSWTYRPTPATLTSTATGPAVPQPVDNATNYRVEPWAVASLDYDLLDEMSVGVGYYNKTNQIGPDGERRGPLWSPEARFFLTLTGNLDPIFQHFKAKPPPQTASSKPQTPSSK
jgi:hypothetical protein